ncbi:hypothetical protein L249_1811 [Ophiocordyceps polyrhachis-furcata BCC 54312]|uniref:WH1 domain-containing protein n=1 Tax=Ophiocordyceps polyrhachis-furcata BCC 54312 TaxID=1330021 RepID=A0A367LP53_9HYPO|nr:hypothetical protein L249_1811 [Ophiocordyceps polyrhachis-furcata BCC 54312]
MSRPPAALSAAAAARHIRQASSLMPAASDYDSDAAAIQAHYAPPPPRTNTELNLSVLQRYLPSIQSIMSMAANAVAYTFDGASESWNKAGIEGTLFVCAQSPLPEDLSSRPRACVFVLNRRGLDNLVVDLGRVSHVEVMDELVMLRVEAADKDGEEKVLGIWIHNDREETREVNLATMQESWKAVRSGGSAEEQGPEAGPAMQAIGRRLSLSDLFGRPSDPSPGQ